MPICCYWNICHGILIPPQTKCNHERATLKNQMVSQQNVRWPDLANTHTIWEISSTTDPLPLHIMPGPDSPSMSNPLMDLNDSPHIINDLNNCLASESEPLQFNQITKDLAKEDQEELCQESDGDQEEFVDEDIPSHQDPDCGPSALTEDDPDPFLVNRHPTNASVNVLDIPHHLLIIYTMVSWLHLQFNLPHIACNAVLAFLTCLVMFFNPQILAPFITLQSITRTLAVDPSIELLAVCPKCRDILPSAASEHMQHSCTSCKIPLFLPDHTKRGISCITKTPEIKYSYLSLSQQLISILKTPGIKALLDNWWTKPQLSGEYGDIFDGNMCHLQLKAHNSSLFFINLSHKRHGPNGELHIGVNLGVDWWVSPFHQFDLTEFHNRFSYICSNIAPSHSSCPTLFSICNLPPKYQWVCIMWIW